MNDRTIGSQDEDLMAVGFAGRASGKAQVLVDPGVVFAQECVLIEDRADDLNCIARRSFSA